MRIFYDLVNIEVNIGDRLDEIAKSSVRSQFDHVKTSALMTALRLIRSRKSTVKIRVIGYDVGILFEHVILVASYVFAYDRIDAKHGDISNLIELNEQNVDIIISTFSSEIDFLALIDRGLNSCSPECLVLLSEFIEFKRHDATISKKTQINTLKKIGFTPIVASYVALFSRGFSFFSNNYADDNVEYSLQDRCLFVFGTQRSATSLIFQILNSNDSILISFEANAYIKKNKISFLENYNNVQKAFRRPIQKGFFLPTLSDPDMTISEIYRCFLQRYRFFGDKLAFGPRDRISEAMPAKLCFDHMMQEFPFARVALSCRRPKSNIVASARINPGLDDKFIIENWLVGIMYVIDFLAISERTVLCPFERIATKDTRPLTALTGIDFTMAHDLISETGIETRDDDVVAWFARREPINVEVVDAAEALYEDLLKHVDAASGRPVGAKGMAGVQECRAAFAELYQRFQSAAGSKS